MARQRAKKKTKKRSKRDFATPLSSSNTVPSSSHSIERLDQQWNFDLAAGPGCHIARHDVLVPSGNGNNDEDRTSPHHQQHSSSSPLNHDNYSSWVLEWETIDPNDYDEDEIPDIALDDGVLILCNLQCYSVVAFLTVYETTLRDRYGQILQQGTTTNDDGITESCTTLIVLCPPHTFAHLCHVDNVDDPNHLRLDSDVQEWNQHLNPSDSYPIPLGFPLPNEFGPYHCTQGEGGQLTHFFAGNLHAVDLACPIGTPLLAVGNGVIVEVRDSHTLTGIAVSNLFQWNSILLQLDAIPHDTTEHTDDTHQLPEGLFIEYVHVATSCVSVGDRVSKGQIIGTSGSVGFSPEPHLHFAAYRSSDPMAPTVRVFFEKVPREHQQQQNDMERDNTGVTTVKGEEKHISNMRFLPKAGYWYKSTGQVQVESTK